MLVLTLNVCALLITSSLNSCTYVNKLGIIDYSALSQVHILTAPVFFQGFIGESMVVVCPLDNSQVL